MAERVGFEPTNTFWVLLTFQASAFDHSATSPRGRKGTGADSGDQIYWRTAALFEGAGL